MAFKSTTSVTTYANAAAMKAAQVEGGTIAQAGNIDTVSGAIKNDLALRSMNSADDSDSQNLGSRVVANAHEVLTTTDLVGVSGADGGATLAFFPAKADRTASKPGFVIRGVSTSLGGNNTDVIRTPGSHYGSNNVRSQERNKISDRLIGSKADEAFDNMARPSTEIVPGRTKGSNAGDATTMVNPADGSAAVASEIKSTRAVPGELVYMYGGKLAASGEYKSKETYES